MPVSSEKKVEEAKAVENVKDPFIIEGNQQHWFDCGGLPLDSDESQEE